MVCTKVGGIPEVLPETMVTLCEPSVDSVIKKLEIAIERIKTGNRMDPVEMHENIKNMYNWRNVAKRTEKVYNMVSKLKPEKTIIEKILRFLN